MFGCAAYMCECAGVWVCVCVCARVGAGVSAGLGIVGVRRSVDMGGGGHLG